MDALAVTDDLFFLAKIRLAAAQATRNLAIARDRAAVEACCRQRTCSLILVDLQLSSDDPIEIIKALRQLAPSASLIGFGDHVQVELQRRARQAGCSLVLARSAFVRQLPKLLTGRSEAMEQG